MYKSIIIVCLILLLPLTNTVYAINIPINVFVSILPLKYFVQRIGKDKVEINVMVGRGQSPETYEPTPKQMMKLSKAKIYYRVGVPFETAWMQKIKKINPTMKVIDLRSRIPMRKLASGTDPHIWTSPVLVMKMAKTIYSSLENIDPANKKIYKKNYMTFMNDLRELDKDIKSKLKNIPSRTFLVFHPAWGYFANAYGLKQIAIEKEGKQPGPRDLTKIISIARRERIKLVIVQPQFSKTQAQMIANVINAKVVVLDPLAENYLNNMRKVCQFITKT